MKLLLFATLLLVVSLQNEVSAKRYEAAARATGGLDLKKLQIKNDELAELEDDDIEKEEVDVPKKSPYWYRRRRCITFYRRRFTICTSRRRYG